MDVGIYVEGQEGVTWRDWRRISRRVEAAGFDVFTCSVHLRSLLAPHREALALWPVMTAIALWTRRLRFGPMVLPVAFSHPVQIARQAAALDWLSEGRFRLRLGAGRDRGEHVSFGFPFPDHDERIGMVGEAIEVIRGLWRGGPFSFHGRWYHLLDAAIRPVPARSWIGVGGNSDATLKITARCADGWCTTGLTPETLGEKNRRLDSLAMDVGRRPEQIQRSTMNGVLIGKDTAALERRARRFVSVAPELAGLTATEILSRLKEQWGWWVGTPQELLAKLESLQAVGIDELFFQLPDISDLRMIDQLAQIALPLLKR